MDNLWVVLVNGVPQPADFGSTKGEGSPICINTQTGMAYFLNGSTVTLASGFPVRDNSVAWPPNGLRNIPSVARSLTFGDEVTETITTVFHDGFEFDTASGALGSPYPGSARFIATPNANNRSELYVFGTTTAFEFNTTPYVLTNPIWHGGNFPVSTGIVIPEGAAASVPTPAAGKQALFIDSADHKLKRKDSSGTVTVIA